MHVDYDFKRKGQVLSEVWIKPSAACPPTPHSAPGLKDIVYI